MSDLYAYDLIKRKLTLAPQNERKVLEDGITLFKSLATRRCLALSPAQLDALEKFDGTKDVHDILFELLKEKTSLGIREYYVLVLHACVNGILTDAVESKMYSGHLLEEYDFKVKWSPHIVLILFFSSLLTNFWVLYNSDFLFPVSLLGWLALLIGVSLVLSLSNLTGACALAGAGRKPCAARVRFDRGLPFFDIDTDDSFMGGRYCQAIVALQKLSVSLVAITVAYLLRQPLFLTSGIISLFVLTAPFGNTPAHNLLHALFRKDYKLPRCANTFLHKRLLWHICRRSRTLQEEHYLLLYSFYAVAWLGLVLSFANASVERFGVALVEGLLFAPSLQAQFFAVVIAALVAFLLAVPLAYQLWFVLQNGYALTLPHLSKWGNRLLPLFACSETANRPSQEECEKFLQSSLLFMELPEEQLSEIAAATDFVEMNANSVIIREHERGDNLYVIYSGEVVVSKQDEAGVSRVAAILGKQDVFGEIALLENVPRTATVSCLTKARLFVLQRQDFDKFLLSNLGADRIKMIIQIGAFLRKCSLFKDCPDYTLLRIAHEFERVNYPAESCIIEQDHPNSRFYLVFHGSCEVFVDDVWTAALEPGDFFGEISLLQNTSAVAEVRAKTPLTCLQLEREQFFDVITRHMLTGITVETAKDARLLYKT